MSVDPVDAPAVASEPELLTAASDRRARGGADAGSVTRARRTSTSTAAGGGHRRRPRADGLGPGNATRWRSLDGLRTALVVLLGCSAAASLAVVVAILNRIDVINDVEAGRITFDLAQRANDADDAVETAASVALVLAIAATVVFIIWQWRCAKNAELLGRDHPTLRTGLEHRRLVHPVRQLRHPGPHLPGPLAGQQCGGPPGQRGGRYADRGSSGIWWAAFVVGAVTSRAVSGDEADTLADLRDQNDVLVAGFVVSRGRGGAGDRGGRPADEALRRASRRGLRSTRRRRNRLLDSRLARKRAAFWPSCRPHGRSSEVSRRCGRSRRSR